MSFLTASERSLLAALREALPDPGDTLVPHRDGKQPWSLYSKRERPAQKTWAAQTFHSLQDKGLIRIERGAHMSVSVSLAGPADLSSVEVKTLTKVMTAAKNSEDGRVALRSGPHRMRYLPGDPLGRKESTYESIRDKGYITIEYGDKGSVGAWFVAPTEKASGAGVAQ